MSASGPESVWDYPRPPRVEPSDEVVEIDWAGRTILRTRQSFRVLETSHPPTYYVPLAVVENGVFAPSDHRTFCEFKGVAHYFDLIDEPAGRRIPNAAWHYPEPTPGYEALRGTVAVYPSRVDECRVDGEVVRSQAGDFYGGWITSRVQGPFKGDPGVRFR